jgi:methylglutaconyl-CoA hydratase
VSKIGFPETRLGIIPGAGGTQRAARLLGLSKTKDLIYTARQLTASEALEWGNVVLMSVYKSQLTALCGIVSNAGLVDYVSEEGFSAFDRALQLAGEIAASAPLALRAAKLAISRASELPLEPGNYILLSDGLS